MAWERGNVKAAPPKPGRICPKSGCSGYFGVLYSHSFTLNFDLLTSDLVPCNNEENDMSNEQGNTTFFMGLLLGAFVGGTVAGLLTPRSGEETRTMVRERGLELKDRAEDVVLRAQNVANDTVVKVKQRIASDNAA
jgi:hypothetical protein